MKSPDRYQESRLRSGARWRGINRPYNEPKRTLIETRRLILRPFEMDDVEAAFTWFGDPIVMRFTPSGPDTSIEQTKARLANYQEHQTARGFSKWIILDSHLSRAIGIRDCSCCRNTVGSNWASARPSLIGARGSRRRQHVLGFAPRSMVFTMIFTSTN